MDNQRVPIPCLEQESAPSFAQRREKNLDFIPEFATLLGQSSVCPKQPILRMGIIKPASDNVNLCFQIAE